MTDCLVHALLRLAWDSGTARGSKWLKRIDNVVDKYDEMWGKINDAAEGKIIVPESQACTSLKALSRLTTQYTSLLAEIPNDENRAKMDELNERLQDIFHVVKLGKGMAVIIKN